MLNFVYDFIQYLATIIASCAVAGAIIGVGITLFDWLDKVAHCLYRSLSGRRDSRS